ncbi:hypothetical protein GLOIN_2v1765169 [Rhizophagus clarus]|uniref:Uncharacterized protein n=1 Tax=Rhizophagus clarus TaxID=94130 RepID=A0A8H3L5F2_9GLOM|nr:hypothetical protein GLOIN_2v1765169 [Rhizophagus clarus]
MASLDNYMIQTPADEWSLLGFLKYRKEQNDDESKHCLDNFKNDVKEACIDRFWHNLIREKQKSELIIIENEMKISQKEKDLLVERVTLQHAGLLYVTAQKAGKQSQIVQQNITNELVSEEASPIITPPPSLRSPPPSYETEDASADTSLDEIDAFFQSPPDVVKGQRKEAKPRKHRSMKDTGSKISTKGVKRNKSIDAVQSTSDEFEPIDSPDKESVESDNSSVSNESKKSSKKILSWKHVAEKIIIDRSSDHDWIMNGYNISESFREFQTQTVELLKNDLSLSYATDVDQILCLSSIIYVKEDKPEYVKCSDQIWKSALPRLLTPETLPVVVKLMILEYSELLTNKDLLLKSWHQNWAKWDPAMTEEEKKIFDCVQLVMRNFFSILTSNGTDHKMDEMIINSFGQAENNKEHEITYGEIKPPSTPNNVVNKALVKLAEFMKGSLDDIGNKPGFETFDILVNAWISILMVLSKRIGRAIEILNVPSTPTNQSYRRLSNSSPQKVILVLKLPPPVVP